MSRRPEWGRHIRACPQESSELLRELREFVPRWDVFGKSSGRLQFEPDLRPIEFYDVLQWLAVHPQMTVGECDNHLQLVRCTLMCDPT
jgi:hypothetical protein